MINIDEARKLIHALEKDLAGLEKGSADIQTLRDEVEALRSLLATPEPGDSWVKDALHSIHKTIDEGAATAKVDAIIASRYVTAIGKMLGL